MPKSVTQVLDDPSFSTLSPEAQRKVLDKLGVSTGIQDKILTNLSAKAKTKTAGTGTAAVPPSYMVRHPAQRESLLGGFSGLGIAETSNPVKDTAKTALHTFADPPSSVPEFLAGPALPAYRMGKGLVEGTYEAGKDILGGLSTATREGLDKKGDPWRAEGLPRAAHGAGQLTTTILSLALGGKKGPELTEHLAQLPKNMREAIPSYVRAGHKFDYVEGTAGHVNLEIKKPLAAAQEAADRFNLTKLRPVPKPLEQFIQRATQERADYPSPGGQIDQSPGISLLEGRKFLADMDSVIYDRDLPPQLKGSLKKFAGELSDELKRTADEQGVGDHYRDALKEFRRAKNIERKVDSPAVKLGGRLVGGLTGFGIGELFGHSYWAGWAGGALGATAAPELASRATSRVLRRPMAVPPSLQLPSTE